MPASPPSTWNHTAHYHQVLLQAVPVPSRRALDVGCGEGAFARRLAQQVELVDAWDRSAEVIARAQLLSKGVSNIRFTAADFLTHPLEPSSYDFIAALATLHHLPFAAAIERMKVALRPGGVLGVIGLYRARSPMDPLLSAVALPVSRFYRLARGLAEVNAPISEPSMTLNEIRDATAQLLPGAVVRRHLLWRYCLVWTKPSESQSQS